MNRMNSEQVKDIHSFVVSESIYFWTKLHDRNMYISTEGKPTYSIYPDTQQTFGGLVYYKSDTNIAGNAIVQ